MSATRDPDHVLHAWLEEGPTVLPAPTVRAIEVATRATAQRRPAIRLPWRSDLMPLPHKFLGAAAALAVVLVGGALLLGPGSDQGTIGGSSPSPTPSTTPAPSASPSAAVGRPIDTSTWTTYTSGQYGFSIGHPADWTVIPATRAWTFEADADDWLSPGMDAFFIEAGGGVRVSAWSVATNLGTPDADRTEVEAWVEQYCRDTKNTPCTGIHDRGVPLCLERRDCHPGLLVPFRDDVQAFFTNGNFGEDMVVVAVWRPQDDSSVATYGGSRRLLEAYLSTLDGGGNSGVYPAPSN